MPKFKIQGLKKRDQRGTRKPTVQTDTIQGKDRKDAEEKFNKKHPLYEAKTIDEEKNGPEEKEVKPIDGSSLGNMPEKVAEKQKAITGKDA